jgi:hypothetical protein
VFEYPIQEELERPTPPPGWRFFSSELRELTEQRFVPKPLNSHLYVSDDCIDELISTGRVCEDLKLTFPTALAANPSLEKLSMVYSWVNGSNFLLQSTREKFFYQTHEDIRQKANLNGLEEYMVQRQKQHFTENDELRFSIKSALKHLGPVEVEGIVTSNGFIENIHLLTGDLGRDDVFDANETSMCEFSSENPVRIGRS